MILSILLSTLVCGFIDYNLNKRFKIDKDDINKIMSSMHAGVISICSFDYLFERITLELLNDILVFSIGYLIYDIINLFIINYRQKYSLVFHHLIMIYGLYTTMVKNEDILYYILSINLTSEVSTYFLNNTLALYEKGWSNSKMFKFNAVGLLLTYFIFRILSGIYCLYFMIYYDTRYILLQLILTSMNFNWFSKLINKYKKINSN